MLYRQEPLLPEEIPFTEYNLKEDYEVALSSHIQHMMDINQQVIHNNQLVQEKTKKWFDRSFVCKQTTDFKVGDLVLFNVKNRHRDLKLGQVH